MSKQINIIGPVTDKTGYGIHLTQLAKALNRHIDVSVTARSHVDPSLANDPMISKMVHTDFRYDCPTIYIWFADCMQLFTGNPRIGFPVFETDRLSQKEVYHLKHLDLIFVTSEWAKSIVNKSFDYCYNGFNEAPGSYPNIVVVREGYDPEVFQPRVVEESHLTLSWKRPYIQNVGKWEVRKGHPELIKVLGSFADEDLRFTFVGHWGNIFQHDWQRQADYHLNAAGFYQIKPGHYEKNDVTFVLSSRLDSHIDLANLISVCDFGVYPHKGEGWCLPILETMACGRPVIATNYSGPTEYLTPEVGILLEPIGFQPIYDPTFFNQGRTGEWCEFSQEGLKDSIREMICMDRDRRIQLGNAALERALEFTWDASAAKVMEVLGAEG